MLFGYLSSGGVRFTVAAIVWLACLSIGWSGVIRGTVSYGGLPPDHSLKVAIYLKDPITLLYDWVTEIQTDAATGSYAFAGLKDGVYRVLAFDPTGYYAMELYQDAYLHVDATPVEVIGGVAQIDPVDIQVELGATISGHVRTVVDGSPFPLEGVIVGIEEMTDTESMQLTGAFVGVATGPDGYFAIGLRPGIYTVDFWDYSPQPRWATQIFDNRIANEWATPIILTNTGHHVANVNAMMQPGYVVSGAVAKPDGTAIEHVAVAVEVFRQDTGEWGNVGSVTTDSAGRYSMNLPQGTYRMFFHDDSMLFEHEFWNDAPDNTHADAVVVTNSDVGGIDAWLEYTPLARWAFGHGLNPFADVEGWLGEDPDADKHINFHEFAFGTDPTDAASGVPIKVGPTTSNTVAISALFHQNLSTAYDFVYQLQYRTNLTTSDWTTEYVGFPTVPPSDPVSYIELGTNVPTSRDPHKFYRLRATINSY